MLAPVQVRQAAEVHRQVRQYIRTIAKPGILMTDLCERLEDAGGGGGRGQGDGVARRGSAARWRSRCSLPLPPPPTTGSEQGRLAGGRRGGSAALTCGVLA